MLARQLNTFHVRIRAIIIKKVPDFHYKSALNTNVVFAYYYNEINIEFLLKFLSFFQFQTRHGGRSQNCSRIKCCQYFDLINSSVCPATRNATFVQISKRNSMKKNDSFNKKNFFSNRKAWLFADCFYWNFYAIILVFTKSKNYEKKLVQRRNIALVCV